MDGSRRTLPFLCLLMLSGCGGGGGGDASGSTATPRLSGLYNSGVFQPASTFKSQCAAPRGGTSDTQGSSTSENNWLRSWTRETYLWYAEVPDLDPSLYTTSAYFPLLKTSAVTASGNPKDKFHFTYPTADWLALSQSGVQAGYGAQWFIVASSPPRRTVVAYVDPGTPAANAGILRGDEVLTVDGVDAVAGTGQSVINTLNAGLFPTAINQSHTIGLKRVNGTTYAVTMTSASVTSTPVQNVSVLNPGTDRVGYLLFNDHIATSEGQLINAVNTLKSGGGITDLILDIRYNGGGYLDIASELAYMVAGPALTTGQTFERLTFNDKNPTTDPVTGQALTPEPFLATAQGFSSTAGTALPTLNLNKVFVITGSGTCSASESIINGLRGVGVNVIQIGTTTCGKPYGFYPTDNCGTTYFTIQFKGVNAAGFGDYTDGFTPTNSIAGTIGTKLPGCAVNDDFSHQLGDVAEARIAAALQYRASSTCPAAPATSPIGMSKADLAATNDGVVARSPVREIRLLRPSGS